MIDSDFNTELKRADEWGMTTRIPPDKSVWLQDSVHKIKMFYRTRESEIIMSEVYS